MHGAEHHVEGHERRERGTVRFTVMRGQSRKKPNAPRLPGCRVKRNAPGISISPSAPIGGPWASGSGRESDPVSAFHSGTMPANSSTPTTRTPEKSTPNEPT